MVSIFKTEKIKLTDKGKEVGVELRGLSTDEKPVKIGDKKIGNGSAFIEIDTGKILFFDGETEEWKGE